MLFPAKITSSCICVALPVDWGLLHWFACGADERVGGRTFTWLPNFLGWVDYFIFVPMVLRCESSAIINFHFSVNLRNLFPTVGVLQLKHQASSWPFVILLLKPLRSFILLFFLIYFNYLVLVFYILQRVSYCHHYFNILLSLFHLLKPVKQFLAPRSNKSEQHNFLKISLIIMHRPWEYREKVDDPKQNRHQSVF